MSNCETVAVTFDVEDIAVEVVCVEPQIEVRVTMSPTWADVADKPAAFPPSAHAANHAAGGSDAVTLTVGQVTGLQAALDAKATPADVTAAVSGLVNSAPAALDTLNELASALGNDANFAATVTTALAAKAPLASPTFTGTVGGITKGMVGLSNVDNTADASKPVSTAQAAADAAVASAAAADATSKANAAQAAAIQRSNHTGTQAIATVNGLQAALDGKVGATDSRLSDARTPTAHKASHATGGTDAMTPADIGAVATNDSRLADQRVPTDGSVTDAKIAAAGLSTSSLNWAAIQPWAANTAYQKGDLVSFQGIAYRRAVAGTSGATFMSANWQQITPTDFVASQIASGTIATARLGSGTASATNYLRGDQAWGEVAAAPAVYEFTTTSAPSGATGSAGAYTWPIPAGVKALQIFMVGAGGGGGSGRVDAAGTARSGGGGGGGASTTLVNLLVSGFSSLDITVGAGGAGGAAVSTGNGNAGLAGAPSTVRVTGQTTRGLLAFGGGGGGGGTSTTGSNGGGQTAVSTIPAVSGGTGRSTQAGDGASNSNPGCGGGGGGGGVDSANTAYGGGVGSPISRLYGWDNSNAAGGNNTGGNGGAAVTLSNIPHQGFGSGGGGGGGRASGGNGGSGGNGYFGGGGGGGGAAVTGNSSGAGGNGGDGLVRIIAW